MNYDKVNSNFWIVPQSTQFRSSEKLMPPPEVKINRLECEGMARDTGNWRHGPARTSIDLHARRCECTKTVLYPTTTLARLQPPT